MTIILTIKECVKRYLHHEGVRCPFCKSYDIEAYNPKFADEVGKVHADVQCFACGETWTDVFVLSGVVYKDEEYS